MKNPKDVSKAIFSKERAWKKGIVYKTGRFVRLELSKQIAPSKISGIAFALMYPHHDDL